jgi:hypothetical protein
LCKESFAGCFFLEHLAFGVDEHVGIQEHAVVLRGALALAVLSTG